MSNTQFAFPINAMAPRQGTPAADLSQYNDKTPLPDPPCLGEVLGQVIFLKNHKNPKVRGGVSLALKKPVSGLMMAKLRRSLSENILKVKPVIAKFSLKI